MRTRAGFARVDVTPPLALPMAGYAARAGVAVGVLDPLCGRVAVLGERRPLVLVALDALLVSEPWAGGLRGRLAAALATERERVLVAATHTHAGPAAFGGAGWGSPPATAASSLPRAAGGGNGDPRQAISAYEERVAQRLVEATLAARAGAEEVELRFGGAEVEGVSASRRAPAEAIDRRVRALAACRRDGSLAGVVAAFGCHPTVLPPENVCYSRDLFGAAVDAAEAALGGTAVLFNGAAADVSTRFTRRAQTADEVGRLGALLADGIRAACAGAAPVRGDEASAALRRVAVRPRALADEAQAAARIAAAQGEVERAEGDPGALRLARSRLEGALAQLWLARNGGVEGLLGRVPSHAEVQGLALGSARLVAVPGEAFSGLARAEDALVIGYANDYLGYLVSPCHAAEGEYESLVAALEPESAAAIERAATELAHG